MKPTRAVKRLKSEAARLKLENSLLREKVSLVGRRLDNNFSQFVDGVTGGGPFGGGDFTGMSNLTSFNPTLQNNVYAPLTLMWTNLMYMYKTHGLIQTAIDMPVLDAVRGGLDLQSDQLDRDELDRLDEYLEEHNVLDRIIDAFIWARLFGGGALVINSEADPTEPLGDEVMDGEIEFYDASRWELVCERRIPATGRYGFYGKDLDASRVITILGKRAPWLIRAQLSDWGMSEVERMMEDFNLFLRNRNVIYELLEEAKVDVYSLDGFKNQLASSTGTNTTVSRVQQMNRLKNFNNALIMDKNDEYHQKQVTFGGLAEMMKENRMGIAAALRMPMSKIFGIPASGLNAGQDDLENYNGLIESEVRGPMRHVIRKVLKVVVRHLFKDDLDVTFRYKPLRVLTAIDEENIRTSKSTRYLNLFDRLLINSKELGEIMQREDLAPIPLRAEQGLLDDHPVVDEGQTTPPQDGEGQGTSGEKDGAEPHVEETPAGADIIKIPKEPKVKQPTEIPKPKLKANAGERRNE